MGSWITIDGFLGLSRHRAGFGKLLSALGNTPDQCGDVQITSARRIL
jgi:hypothetical protein